MLYSILSKKSVLSALVIALSVASLSTAKPTAEKLSLLERIRGGNKATALVLVPEKKITV